MLVITLPDTFAFNSLSFVEWMNIEGQRDTKCFTAVDASESSTSFLTDSLLLRIIDCQA
jgi:hypothetical protein